MGFQLTFKSSITGLFEHSGKKSASEPLPTTEAPCDPVVSKGIQLSAIEETPTQEAALPFKTIDVGGLLGCMTVTSVRNGVLSDNFLAVADREQAATMANDLARLWLSGVGEPALVARQPTCAVSCVLWHY